QIPDKLYFRMGEVSRLVGVKPYVLRYWETEFPAIAPRKAGSSHRLYRRKDVVALLEIKRLLYEKRFTIAGARKALAARENAPQQARGRRAAPQAELFGGQPDLTAIRRELAEILKLLS
ncbi:MAG TPA: MerR family transcriptional regulator, partial [Bryobacteraceae bacterium]|nr:MerR family transcriptional regulator [Bryobacteraceae bacterium]